MPPKKADQPKKKAKTVDDKVNIYHATLKLIEAAAEANVGFFPSDFWYEKRTSPTRSRQPYTPYGYNDNHSLRLVH